MENKNYIEQVGKHLGRTSDGGFMKPYEAPLQHDASLLVPIPREYGRKAADIDISRVGYGYEIWHAYEFSYLISNNAPRTGILKARFDYLSENMIESKSFKLYLNSFDFEKRAPGTALPVEKDLSVCAKDKVKIGLTLANKNEERTATFRMQQFESIDAFSQEIKNISFEEGYEIEVYHTDSMSSNEITFHTANLRSNCEITNQKDTGHCFISFIPRDKTTTMESIARLIFSLRNSQHFHENVTEIIYDKLHKCLDPYELFVGNIYNRRGGLDIHSVRASSYAYHDKILGGYEDVSRFYRLTNQV